jgi:cytochrome b6-f complex iron-sulfur subunit
MGDSVLVVPLPLTRREFLFYIWTASMALSLAGTTGLILWFAYPRFRAGEFGGTFTLDASKLPDVAAPPEAHQDGRFWLVNSDRGVLALYVVCVHLGCLYKWVPSNNRFECPCHGSKYQRTGEWIEGPAPRNLDRFVIQAVDSAGKSLAETKKGDANADSLAGGPLAIPAGVMAFQVDTSDKVRGRNHA